MSDIVMLRSRPFPPEPRGLREAQSLVDAGYSVRVVAWDRELTHPRTERIDGIEVVRIRIPCPYASFPAYALTLPLFLFRALPHCLARGVRAVHCADLDTMPAGLLAARIGGRRLVFDIYDSYPGMMAGNAPGRVVSWVRRFDRRMARAADLRLVVSTAFADQYVEAGPSLLLPNTSARSQFERVGDDQVKSFRKNHGLEDVYVVGYAGVLMPGRGIEECIAACEGLEGVRFLIAGFGQLEPEIRRLVAASGNTKFIGRLAPDQVPLLTRSSDVLMNVLDPENETYRLTVPNKLYDALLAGRRALVSEGTHSAEFAARAGIGVQVRFGDVAGLRAAIQRISELPPPFPGGAGSGDGHDWTHYGKRLADAYRSLIGLP